MVNSILGAAYIWHGYQMGEQPVRPSFSTIKVPVMKAFNAFLSNELLWENTLIIEWHSIILANDGIHHKHQLTSTP